MNKETFIKIFENEQYRKIIDKVILNFYGLDNNIIIQEDNISQNDIILEFFILLNEELLFKIKVIDTKNMFKESKQFFLNFCNKRSKKEYSLVLPCYWEFYYQNCFGKNKYKILDFASLFICATKKELEHSLLKLFDKNTTKEILKLINL